MASRQTTSEIPTVKATKCQNQIQNHHVDCCEYHFIWRTGRMLHVFSDLVRLSNAFIIVLFIHG